MEFGHGPLRSCTPLLLAGGAILTILLLTPAPPASANLLRPAVSATFASTPQLGVDPPTWWMPAGNVTGLAAAWVDLVPGCTLLPLWFRWSIPGPSVEGTLNSTTSTNVTFEATSALTGTTTVRVRSAAILDCEGNRSAITGVGEANVTVVAPITLQNVSMAPNPVPAGSASTLEGTVNGGAAPYVLRITWGDGTVSLIHAARSGGFAIDHVFSAGRYEPNVVATDSTGLVAEGGVPAPLTSTNTTAVGLTTANTEVDVGFPVSFTATVLDEPNGSSTGWSCSSEGAAVGVRVENATDFACAFSVPGPGDVFFEVLPPVPYPLASATLLESVEALPALSAVSPAMTVEVGQPCAVTFNISGGVPPFLLEWQEIGTLAQGTLSATTDGRVLLPLTPIDPGSLQLVARLVDADGATTSNATTQFIVDPSLNATAASARTLTTSGAELDLTGSVSAGAPPFLWVVSPSPRPANESGETGQLGSAGSFGWQGNYSFEGPATITWAVVDAAGGFSSATIDAEAVTPLTGAVAAVPGGPSAPGTFDLDVSVSGGLPPFRLDVNASDGETWNRTISADGRSTLALTATSGGPIVLVIVTSDALGDELSSTASVTVQTPPPARTTPASASPANPLTFVEGAAALLALAGAASVLYLARRRRGRPTPTPEPDPVAVLRRIVEPSDGADRVTVELLAEEAGVRLEDAHATIDRLIADGTLRAETDPDGGEVLSWSTLEAR